MEFLFLRLQRGSTSAICVPHRSRAPHSATVCYVKYGSVLTHAPPILPQFATLNTVQYYKLHNVLGAVALIVRTNCNAMQCKSMTQ